MVILQDTREQRELKFSHPYVTEVRRVKLDFGDYGCEFKDGHKPPVYFERKTISDLFGTLGAGYKRFKREIVRSQIAKSTLVVIIEGTLRDVLKGKGAEYSKMQGTKVVAQLFTLWVKHGVIPVFCKDSSEMSEYITQFYISCGKEYVRKKKEEAKK